MNLSYSKYILNISIFLVLLKFPAGDGSDVNFIALGELELAPTMSQEARKGFNSPLLSSSTFIHFLKVFFSPLCSELSLLERESELKKLTGRYRKRLERFRKQMAAHALLDEADLSRDSSLNALYKKHEKLVKVWHSKDKLRKELGKKEVPFDVPDVADKDREGHGQEKRNRNIMKENEIYTEENDEKGTNYEESEEDFESDSIAESHTRTTSKRKLSKKSEDSQQSSNVLDRAKRCN